METQASYESLTPAQKGKHTKAMKKFGGTAEERVIISEMVCLFILSNQKVDFDAIDQEMSKRARVEAAQLDQQVAKPTRFAPAIDRGMSLEAVEFAAKELLGPDAVVWSATQDSKGRVFPAPRFRVGIKTDKPESYVVEQGRLMIGTGPTAATALSDTRKRLAAASDAAPKAATPAAQTITQVATL